MAGVGISKWLPVVLSHTATFIVGLVGNLLVIYSIAKCRRLQNVTNTFLASLATADLIIIVIVIPIQTPFYFSSKWVLGGALCKLLPYLTLLSSSCSVFMLTALSVERYVVIVHPLLAKTIITPGRTRRFIVILWFVAIVYSFPPLFYRKHKKWSFGNHPPFYTCNNSDDEILGKAYSLYLLLGMYLIPLFIMTFCYVRIIYELWISTKRFKDLQERQMRMRRERYINNNSEPGGVDMVVSFHGGDESDDSEVEIAMKGQPTGRKSKNIVNQQLQGRKQVIRMLIVAVFLFMICWGPVLWLKFAIEFGYIERYSPIRTYLSIAFNLLSYLNSCMNPICYAFISRTFRECFCWAITAGCSSPSPNGTTVTTTTTTHLPVTRTNKAMYRPISLQRLRNSDATDTPDDSPDASPSHHR
ncbi:QRFP-like peptide receptor [Ptychodera flava]|uniref:QRFP-like peptide receptor n=1 Tax=Ptychodera flava TaxID=63121 RepID=UPI003969C144